MNNTYSAASTNDISEAGEAGAGEGPAARERPPRFHAKVELLEVDGVHVLTEDRSVSKQILRAGFGRRTPRLGDLVSFSTNGMGEGGLQPEAETPHMLLLGEGAAPHAGLEHVLLSMREGERCLATLRGAAPEEGDAAERGEETRRLVVTMHRWRRRDSIPVPQAAADAGACEAMRKLELRAGPERLAYEIEDGSIVLIGIAPAKGSASPGGGAPASAGPALVLSWCMGEGAVPGYLEAAVCSMRLWESAIFDAPAGVVSATRVGPAYEGQTPLRRPPLPGLAPFLAWLLDDARAQELAAARLGAGQGAGEGADAAPSSAQAPLCSLPADWAESGEPALWEDLGATGPCEAAGGVAFRLALLAATEAADVCLMEDEAQAAYLGRERARGL